MRLEGVVFGVRRTVSYETDATRPSSTFQPANSLILRPRYLREDPSTKSDKVRLGTILEYSPPWSSRLQWDERHVQPLLAQAPSLSRYGGGRFGPSLGCRQHPGQSSRDSPLLLSPTLDAVVETSGGLPEGTSLHLENAATFTIPRMLRPPNILCKTALRRSQSTTRVFFSACASTTPRLAQTVLLPSR